MSSELVLKIRLFGAFRNLALSNEVEVKICKKSTVRDVKLKLISVLKSANASFDVASLVAHSVLADSVRILEDSDQIEKELCLSVLPPVCGG